MAAGRRSLVSAGAMLLDVREDDEWAAGHAPAAVHLPMGQVVDRVAEVPTDRIIVCMCRGGGRSGSVALHLAGAGYDVRNVAGGMQAWAAADSSSVTFTASNDAALMRTWPLTDTGLCWRWYSNSSAPRM